MDLAVADGSGDACTRGCARGSAPVASRSWIVVCISALVTLALSGCGSGPSQEQLAAVDYTPRDAHDWRVSTPAEQGLDPMAVARLYFEAGQLESIYSLLVVKDGYLVGEDYFHASRAEEQVKVQSVTKSFTSALVGIALDEGCLTSVDEPMLAFFPELRAKITDPRKEQITIRHLLQMRAGYPWEESSPELFDLLYSGFRPSDLVDVPLVRDPGTGFDYSNLSAHLLAIVVSRACDTDLKAFADEHLFAPLGTVSGRWTQDWEGYRYGSGELHLRARDMAMFGQLYLGGGTHEGQQIVPEHWVRNSWQVYSPDAWHIKVGDNFDHTSYGYLWWSVTAGSHTYRLAWGHGGQQIAVVDDLGMVVVVTADPLMGEHGDGPWRLERANLNLVADFVASLPDE
jgi:CubicO group peptidase (beta-lactamase class C family)